MLITLYFILYVYLTTKYIQLFMLDYCTLKTEDVEIIFIITNNCITIFTLQCGEC